MFATVCTQVIRLRFNRIARGAFTTPHFDGYAAVLVQLERISVEELEELIVEAWLARAPKRLAREYVETHFPKGSVDGE